MVLRCCSATVRIIAYQNTCLCCDVVCVFGAMDEEGLTIVVDNQWEKKGIVDVIFFFFSLWQLYIILLTILRVFKMDDQSIMPYVYIIILL